MALVVCPICRKKFESTQSDSLPFCGKRCKEIDLGRWLGESYAFPVTRQEDEEEEELGEQPPPDEE